MEYIYYATYIYTTYVCLLSSQVAYTLLTKSRHVNRSNQQEQQHYISKAFGYL